MAKHRRYFSPDDKIAILSLNVLEGASVAQICNEHGINATVFYRWRKRLIEHGAAAFWPQRSSNRHENHTSLSNGASKPHEGARQSEIEWMASLAQAKIDGATLGECTGDRLTDDEIRQLLDCIHLQPLKYRNRAVAILAYNSGIRVAHIASFLGVSHSTVDNWVSRFTAHDCTKLLSPYRSDYQKIEDKQYETAIFEILHAPPSSYGINRTTWRQKDIQSIMARRGLPIARRYVGKIIKNAGYHYRKAKTVLTSTDPNYREKVKEITRVLSQLGVREKFFSVDEFGPFAVKKRGGRSLVKRGCAKTVPQRQASKGCLIVTGALELSTNQMTHFYSEKKNTAEMIKLLDVLIDQYADQECIYFSWDAASWHASKALYRRVDEINATNRTQPRVKLVPLPCSAQFLNVIESVFSGMARAVLHNSDYASVMDCKKAIDRHFAERNEHFRLNPKRAGDKIWGKERVPATFRESNNCKDPRYR